MSNSYGSNWTENHIYHRNAFFIATTFPQICAIELILFDLFGVHVYLFLNTKRIHTFNRKKNKYSKESMQLVPFHIYALRTVDGEKVHKEKKENGKKPKNLDEFFQHVNR